MADTQERVYTIPLRKARGTARYKRTEKAVRIMQAFLARHMKTDNVWIGQALNEHVWAKGIRNPPRRVTVHVQKHNGTAYAELQGVEIRIPSEEEKKKQDKARKEALKKLETAKTEDKPEGKKIEEKAEEAKPEETKEVEKTVPAEKPKKQPKTEKHEEKAVQPDANKA